MTAQISDGLRNDCQSVDLGSLQAYAVITSSPTENYGWGKPYPFRYAPDPDLGTRTSANWNGFVSQYRLNADGTLELTGYAYPVIRLLRKSYGDEVEDDGNGRWLAIHHIHDRFSEVLAGDFWLVLKEEFRGPRTYVPFRDGRVVADRAEWFIEEEPP